jgi:hypothetical protein
VRLSNTFFPARTLRALHSAAAQTPATVIHTVSPDHTVNTKNISKTCPFLTPALLTVVRRFHGAGFLLIPRPLLTVSSLFSKHETNFGFYT